MDIDNKDQVEESYYTGVEVNNSSDLKDSIAQIKERSIDFIILPIAHTNFDADTFVPFEDIAKSYVALISYGDNFTQYNDQYRKAMHQEVSWAHYLSATVLFQEPTIDGSYYAQIISEIVHKYPKMEFWVRIELRTNENADTAWQRWNNLRTICGHPPNLFVDLYVSRHFNAQDISKWEGEPMRALTFTVERLPLTLNNVANDINASFIASMFKLNVRIVLSINANSGNDTFFKVFRCFKGSHPELQDLYRSRNSLHNDRIEEGLLDLLLDPMQPLRDNLISRSYEGFEREKVKYSQYEQAMYQAMLTKPHDRTLVVMVMGAGRGPLVLRAREAAKRASRTVKIFAIEKNPNAVVVLDYVIKKENIGDIVQRVNTDMRSWKTDERADIIVSELLGSFGDNELSPECIDGMQHLLADNGTMIPCSYTSFVAPITSSKLWNEAKAFKTERHMETFFVSRLHNYSKLTTSQACFTFIHPNNNVPIDNTRYNKMSFPFTSNAMVHGFAGYFSTVLFQNVTLSIVPETETPDMYAWFPLYIPIKDPLYVKNGEVLQLEMWRNNSDYAVWYEWKISNPIKTSISNPMGRSYTIGLN